MMELLAKEASWSPQTTQDVAKAIGFSLQAESKARLPKRTSTPLTEHRDAEPVPACRRHLCRLVFVAPEGALRAIRGER